MEPKIKKAVNEFFKLLEIEEKPEVDVAEEVVMVTVSSDDPGLLIGYHGETLESLQLMLSLYISKKIGEFRRVSLEIGDYKKNREEWLKNLAAETKERVLTEGKEVTLTDLKAWERRIVHLELAEDKDVVSESSGEGRDRFLVVRPK